MYSFILYDTEFTAWPGSQHNNWSREGEYKEIIQLAAMKLEFDGKQLHPVSSMNVLVKPKLNPQLSLYIIELTGIHQELIDDHGIDYDSCARQFFEFSEQGKIPCLSWGPDQVVLKINHELNLLPWEYGSETFRDLKSRLYQLGFDYRRIPSGGLAESVGLKLEGHIHNALYDVKSISAFLNKLLVAGDVKLESLLIW